jgi:uncharacterized protein YndB with AHSA1/START domain
VIAQTIQFSGLRPETLYEAYLSSEQHSAMTAGALHATFLRDGKQVQEGYEGDELRAFGSVGEDGEINYSLEARVLRLVPGRLILMSWKNKAWNLAVDPGDVDDLASTVELTFAANLAGTEVRLVQSNVPAYRVRIPETGEVGPLSDIVNTHWSLLYWEPMRAYFQQPRQSARR